MPNCPFCNFLISGKDVTNTISFKPYSSCPNCDGHYTVDRATKRRQIIAILIVLISLTFTIGWCFLNQEWLIPSIVSYIVLIGFIIWANRKVRYIAYK